MNLVAAALPAKWKLVGVQLGLSFAKLDEIESYFHGDCIHCFGSMFSEWEKMRHSDFPYCWDVLVNALQTPSIGENKVAEDIKSFFTNNYNNVSTITFLYTQQC